MLLFKIYNKIYNLQDRRSMLRHEMLIQSLSIILNVIIINDFVYNFN